jgi:hypothetical protein
MKNLQLSLKTKWFEMTKAGIKTEDYRVINNYWLKRFFEYRDPELLDDGIIDEFVYDLNIGTLSLDEFVNIFEWKPIKFEQNVMTLGYPKSTDKDRILRYEHAGIEIREGNTDWGAEPGKIYFVIKHGKSI